MHWIELQTQQLLADLHDTSFIKPQVIFKHSIRCSISALALNRFEREATAVDRVDFYYLDLIKYRELSNRIASDYKVYHESPQLLLISNGNCIYEASHYEIRFGDLMEQLSSAN